jgi:hypothetical protein
MTRALARFGPTISGAVVEPIFNRLNESLGTSVQRWPGRFRPRRRCCRPASRSSVVPVARCQEVIDDKVSHVTAQPLTGRKVK